MDVDHCGSWVAKRSLNLETFLRKRGKEFGFPRYYDTCALESKGALALRHVVVTDSTLFFTESVPKNVILFIPLKNVKNIEVVADRKALLKGGKSQQYICQHVQLHCTSPSKTVEAAQPSPSNQDILKDRNGRKSTTPTNMATLPDSDSSFTDFSRQSSRLDGSFLPPGLLEAYESHFSPRLPPLLLVRNRVTDGSTSSSSSSTPFGLRVGRTRGNVNAYHRPRRNFSETGSTSELDVSSSETTGRRAKTMEEQKLNDINPEEIKRIRPRPRSLDLNQVTGLKQKMLQLVLRESPHGREKSSSHNISSNSLENKGFYVDFYLYRPNSLMLNELFLFWNRQRLKTLLREDLNDGDVILRGMRAAEKAFSKLSHLFSSPGQNHLTEFQDDFLPKLSTAHKALVKYDHLPRILWKEWTLITHFLTLLKVCLTSKSIGEEDEDIFVDRLFSIAILMDIFRLLIEATGSSWFLNGTSDFNNNSLRNNNRISFAMDEKYSEVFSSISIKERSEPSTITSLHELTSTLVGFILSTPTNTGSKECSNLGESRWLCSTDTKAIKAVSLVHNSSVALLHEILSIVHFSPKESFLNLSMMQILNLLWDNGETLGASQIVMLYRLVHTAQTLTTYNAPLQFLRHNFSEEFRYFVHEDSVNKKIPDRYPLKPMLLSLCEQLRQEIIDK